MWLSDHMGRTFSSKSAIIVVEFWTTVWPKQPSPCPPPTQHRKKFQNKSQRRFGKNQDLRIGPGAAITIMALEWLVKMYWPGTLQFTWKPPSYDDQESQDITSTFSLHWLSTFEQAFFDISEKNLSKSFKNSEQSCTDLVKNGHCKSLN